ncbi:MAG: hypothetical protein ACRELY_01785 [Polyangiaceae bacterium]
MHFTRIASRLVAVSLLTLVGACSSSSASNPAGPVVDSLDVPDTVAVSTIQTTSGPQQGYELQGNLNFHDDAEKVNSFTAHVTDPVNTLADAVVEFPNPPGPVSTGPLQAILAFPQGGPLVAGKVIKYEITVTSVSGKVSAPLEKTVTLE